MKTTDTVRIHKCDACTTIFQCPNQLGGDCFGCTEYGWYTPATLQAHYDSGFLYHIDYFCVSCAEDYYKGIANG